MVGMESISVVSSVRDEDKQLNDVVSGAEYSVLSNILCAGGGMIDR